jgi:hypothetical protein
MCPINNDRFQIETEMRAAMNEADMSVLNIQVSFAVSDYNEYFFP